MTVNFGDYETHTRRQEESDAKVVYISGITLGLAHTALLIILTRYALDLNQSHFSSGGPCDVWLWLLALVIEVGVIGGLGCATIFGANLLWTCHLFGLNTNDALSALRLETYKNFLRIKISGDAVIIYPIGLDTVRKHSDWLKNKVADGLLFVPPTPLAYHLIENSIVWRGH